MVLTLKQFGAMAGMLLFGGITTVSQNDYLQFTTLKFPNYIGQIVAFNYPWFGNFLMFLAMTLLCFLWLYQHKRDGPKPKHRHDTITKQLFSSPWICLIFSSIFDLIASGMMSVGLNLGVPPSVYQMLNGSIIVFTPILSYFCLKRKISKSQIVGMIVVILGLATVAISSYLVQRFFSEVSENRVAVDGLGLFLGMLLIIAAQVIYAGQFVLEEYTMQFLECYAAQVVCIEGIYGFILTVCFVMPIFDLAGVENDFDAFVFFGAQPDVLVPVGLFFVTVAVYNAYGQTVTKLISANHRTIIEGLRGLAVWIFSLIERAIFGGTRGEGFYSWASAVQMVGFVIQLIGSFIFYEIIKFKCFDKSVSKDTEDLIKNEPSNDDAAQQQ